ncbi:hypothetical protein ACFO3J_32430 [Streptomyces polygonati]|uniref:Uncharacterized protein n=1 Tax=Streptomyces polygonati TaxID=1617087 RepID=A0ABV8HVN0_9ACTN
MTADLADTPLMTTPMWTVRERMRTASVEGGFLVLVVDSSVGKTRLLYESARAVLGDFVVLAPELGDGGLVNTVAVAAFPLPRPIVWLDELQRFVPGPYFTAHARARRPLPSPPTPRGVVPLQAHWSAGIGKPHALACALRPVAGIPGRLGQPLRVERWSRIAETRKKMPPSAA